MAAALGVATASLSTRMIWHGTEVGVGDCLLFDDVVHMVRACALLADELYMALSSYERVARVGSGSFRLRLQSSDLTMLKLAERPLRLAAAWHEEPDGTLVCLL